MMLGDFLVSWMVGEWVRDPGDFVRRRRGVAVEKFRSEEGWYAAVTV